MSLLKRNILLFLSILIIILEYSQFSNIISPKINYQTSLITKSTDIQMVKNVPVEDNLIALSTADFPLGWYDIMNRPQTPEAISQQDFNILMPYGGSSYQMISTYLDAAAAAGVKIMLPVNPNLEQVKAGDVAQIKEKIRTFKNHPAIYGWYIADEPDLRQTPAKLLVSVYQAVKEEDPTRPIAIAFNTNLSRIKKYADAYDILMYDKYPCLEGYPEFSSSPPYVNIDFLGERIPQIGNYAKNNNKLFFPIVQAFGKRHRKRFCSGAEMKYLIYMSLLSGADGLFFYAYHRTEQSWLDSILLPLTEELHTYLPTVKNKPLSCQIKSDQLTVQGCLYQNPNTKEYILIAINHSKSKVRASIRLDPKMSITSARLLGENRYISGISENLQDIFSPYGVHIYKLYSFYNSDFS